jgi:hypothetical protein
VVFQLLRPTVVRSIRPFRWMYERIDLRKIAASSILTECKPADRPAGIYLGRLVFLEPDFSIGACDYVG